MQCSVTVVNLIHDTVTETDRPVCHVIPGCSWREKQDTSSGDPQRVVHVRLPSAAGYLPYAQWAKLPPGEKAGFWTLKRGGKLIVGAVRSLTEAEYAALEKTHICCTVAAVSDNREPLLPHFHVEGVDGMSKPIFDQPYGLKYQVDGIQMQLSWRPDFGAEKTAALQKAQYAMAQEAARLIDSYVPFKTGELKNSVQTASKYDEGLLVYDTPYARKQYYLHPEGSDLHTFMGNKKLKLEADKYKGLRGSYWGQRALADMGEHLALFATSAVTTFWGGMGHL